MWGRRKRGPTQTDKLLQRREVGKEGNYGGGQGRSHFTPREAAFWSVGVIEGGPESRLCVHSGVQMKSSSWVSSTTKSDIPSFLHCTAFFFQYGDVHMCLQMDLHALSLSLFLSFFFSPQSLKVSWIPHSGVVEAAILQRLKILFNKLGFCQKKLRICKWSKFIHFMWSLKEIPK